MASINIDTDIETTLFIADANEFIDLYQASVDKWFNFDYDLNKLLEDYNVPWTITKGEGKEDDDGAGDKFSGDEFVDENGFTTLLDSVYQTFRDTVKGDYSSQEYKIDENTTIGMQKQMEDELKFLLDKATSSQYDLTRSDEVRTGLGKIKPAYVKDFLNAGETSGNTKFKYTDAENNASPQAHEADFFSDPKAQSFHSQTWTRQQLAQVLEVATREMGRREQKTEPQFQEHKDEHGNVTNYTLLTAPVYKLKLQDDDTIACCIQVTAQHAHSSNATVSRKWGLRIRQKTTPAP